jgi:amino acid permease
MLPSTTCSKLTRKERKIYSMLTLCMCAGQLSLRYTLDCLVAGEDAPFSHRRHLALTTAAVFSSLAVALAFPNAAEKIFAITGATAVAAVCYLIPVALHLMQRRQALTEVRPWAVLHSAMRRGDKCHM